MRKYILLKINSSSIFIIIICIQASIFELNSQPLIKSKLDSEIWSFFSFESYIKSKNRIFIESNFRHVISSEFPELSSSLPFERIQIELGYEWMLSEKWYGAISERVAFEPDSKIFFTGLFLEHQGKLNVLEFTKRLGFEYVSFNENNSSAGSRGQDLGRFSFYFHLAKKIKVGSLNLRPVLSNEIFQWYEFSAEKRKNDKQRRIDKTRLKLEINLQLNERLMTGVFAMKEVDYFYLLSTGGRFDKDGILIEPPQPERKNNRISPTYGFNILYKIGSRQIKKG